MSLDPELLKELIATFKTELDEQLQIITNELLVLEKAGTDTAIIKEKIETVFRSAHTIKGAARGLGISNVGEIAHRIESLFSSIQKNEIPISREIVDLCLNAVDKMRSSMESYLTQKPLTFDLVEFLQHLDSRNKAENSKPKKAVVKPQQENVQPDKVVPTSATDTIRVAINKLDKVSALMEEIQVNKIAIDDYYFELSQLAGKMKQFNQLWKQLSYKVQDVIESESNDGLERLYLSNNDCLMEISNMTHRLQKNMRSQINELSTISASLQEEIRTLRLVPANHFLCHLPRYVRDLSQELNKEIELHIKGDDVKMDKLILEGLKDPIIHILRNAMDHGIEDSEMRIKNGKSNVGHVSIDIKEEGNQIIIEMSDDGAGLDIKQIARIAEQKNLATKAEIEGMTEKEIIDFIFAPGFSTKEIITDISGRGVGLNVVKTNLNDLNGQISVKAELGKGSIFSLRVPFTLSSERGLLISIHNQLFVIPTSSVERVLIIHPSEIVEVEGSQAIILNKHTIPLRTLVDVLNYEKIEMIKQDKLAIIVIKRNERYVALLVDKIIGEREIVIKRLNLPLSNVNCVAGATLLERNQAVIVLNPSDLINTALHISSVRLVSLQDDINKSVTKPHILVVDDSITTRTLEKNILEHKNYQVTVAVNGKEAWDMLQKQQFALLITDVAMPIMDGFTLTENVKKSEKLKNLPVIIVTSLDSDAEKARGIEVGANAYIVKNQFESGALLEIVDQLV